MRRMSLVIALPLLLAACGGTDPGTGSQTLYVEATAEQSGGHEAELRVLVREGSSEGDIVNDAVVTLRDMEDNEYKLQWDGVQVGEWRQGAYGRSGMRWSPGWEIEVQRGDDRLEAFLEAPGETEIVKPAPAATIDLTDLTALKVEWNDAEGMKADHVEIRLGDYREQLTEDDGRFEIPLAAVALEGTETLEIRRWNETHLAGGTAGSRFRAEVRTEAEFDVLP